MKRRRKKGCDDRAVGERGETPFPHVTLSATVQKVERILEQSIVAKSLLCEMEPSRRGPAGLLSGCLFFAFDLWCILDVLHCLDFGLMEFPGLLNPGDIQIHTERN